MRSDNAPDPKTNSNDNPTSKKKAEPDKRLGADLTEQLTALLNANQQNPEFKLSDSSLAIEAETFPPLTVIAPSSSVCI